MNHVMAMDIDLARVRHNWGWVMVFGFLLMILGILAASWAVATTVVSMAFFGALLVASGLLEIGSAVGHYRTQHFWFHLLGGTLDLVFGTFIFLRPMEGALVLTLLLAALLFVGGIYRVVGAIALRLPAWGWAVASGIVNVALAVMLYRGWPVSGLWFIGLCIGIALIFRGWAWTMLGLLAHRAPDQRWPEPRPQDSPVI